MTTKNTISILAFVFIIILNSCEENREGILWKPGVEVTPSKNQITLIIENTSHSMDPKYQMIDPDKLEIYFGEDSTNLLLIKKIIPAETEVVVDNLTSGTKYFFVVKAVKKRYTFVSSNMVSSIPL